MAKKMCVNEACKQKGKPKLIPGKNCPTCFKALVEVVEEEKHFVPKVVKEVVYGLIHGDEEKIALTNCAAYDSRHEITSGSVTLRMLQCTSPIQLKDTVLLVAHGRQPLVQTTESLGFSMRSFAYMTPGGHQLFRPAYTLNLPDYAAKLIEQPLAWVTSDVPVAYVGPHTVADKLSDAFDAFAQAARLCDVVVFTGLTLADGAPKACLADGKVPLGEIVTQTPLRSYRNFLLMCCRSPWNEDELVIQNKATSGEDGATASGMLYAYDDSFRIPVS